jgi:hypothetical protein
MLAAHPLWPDGFPFLVKIAWERLESTLLDSDRDWEVWTDWYRDRLRGLPGDTDLELARVKLPEGLWRNGPEAVNAAIRRLIEKSRPSEPIPAQGAGPHVILNSDLKIALAPLAELDPEGNNLARLRQLLPLARQAAGDLAGHLNPNTQPELARIVTEYRVAIADEPEKIPWSIVFGLGVRLDNAATAARRLIEDRMRPPLEDAEQEALDSVLTLHGPLVLATAEGRELSEEADRFNLTRDQQTALRTDAQTIVDRLKHAREIAEPAVIEITDQAAEAIGEGPHPERGTAYWFATVKNVSTILVPAATLGAFAWWIGGFGGTTMGLAGSLLLRENERICDAAKALAGEYNRLVDLGMNQGGLAKAQAVERLRLLTPFRDFVTANEEPLRRIAGYSTNLRWMLRYIDFIVRTKPD